MKVTRSIFLTAILLVLLSSCTESIDTTSRYVFKEHTAASYLEAHDDYSQYVELLKQVRVSLRSQTTMFQLLSARGNYTVFAPTNTAIEQYLQKLADQEIIPAPSWESITDSAKLDSLRKVVVHNSVIDGEDISEQIFYTNKFPEVNNGELALPNMLDHKINVSTIKGNDTIYINGDCPIDPRNYDIPVINGVIHQLHKVIAPDDITAARYLGLLIEKDTEGYLVLAKCIQACGLMRCMKPCIRKARFPT